MSEKNTGGPAFPINDAAMVHTVAAAAIQGVTDSAERDRIYIEASRRAASGMTLRDYFAAKAMQAFVSSYQEGEITNPMDDIAEDSYAMADAMLNARSA